MTQRRDIADWPEGYHRKVMATVDSTMSEAARMRGALTAPTWILGLEQTDGRGRRGRAWKDPTGNFAATLVFPPSAIGMVEPGHAALRSFVASLALYDALVAATGRPQAFALKWPNDVLLMGQKLAGILLESSGAPGRIEHFAIGIGVNLMRAPEVLEESHLPPVSLAGALGIRITPEAFLSLLAPAYGAWETRFMTEGFGPIRTAWLSRAARLGEVITARTMRQSITGTFQTVDEGGNLVLTTAKGPQVIAAADIFF